MCDQTAYNGFSSIANRFYAHIVHFATGATGGLPLLYFRHDANVHSVLPVDFRLFPSYGIILHDIGGGILLQLSVSD